MKITMYELLGLVKEGKPPKKAIYDETKNRDKKQPWRGLRHGMNRLY